MTTLCKIHCIVVDDEPLAIKQMTDFVNKIDFLHLEASFDNAIEALNYIKTKEPDLVFLDIQMDDLSGIELLKSLTKKPIVVLTTAYDSYAIQGYELEVTDYLLKPVSYQRFLTAVNKVYDRFKLQSSPQLQFLEEIEKTADFIFVKTKYQMQKIIINEVLYIEGLSNYLMIHTPKEKIYTLQNFSQLFELLPAEKFIRIHKSFIVAVDKIDSISKNHIKIGDKNFPVGETYKKSFFDFLEKKKLI